jgi:hypothetical protein
VGDKIKKNVKGRVCSSRIWEGRGGYRVLVGKPERKRPLRRPRRRLEDNIKMHIQEVGCGGRYWIGPAQDRNRWQALVNAVMNLQISINCGEFLAANQLASQEGLCSME